MQKISTLTHRPAAIFLFFIQSLLFYAILLGSFAGSNAMAQNLSWAKALGGPAGDVGYAVAVDADGNVYTTGYFSGTVDFDPGPGTFSLTANSSNNDLFISKLDSNGNFIWAVNIGGGLVEWTYSIATDYMSNVYLTGFFQDTVDFDPGVGVYNLISAGNEDIFVCKLDSAGSFLWARSVGGAIFEDARTVAVDTYGNVYYTGFFQGTVDFDPGSGVYYSSSSGQTDVFISKLDANGNFLWVKKFGGTSIDRSHFLTLDATGNIYTTGQFSGTVDFDPGTGNYNLTSAGGGPDIFVSKLDTNGNFKWARAMGSITGYDAGIGLAVDASENVYTTGYCQGIADFDPGPGVFNLVSAGSDDIFISKLDSSGNFQWATSMGSTVDDRGIAIAVDNNSNVFTSGYFKGTVDFDPGPATLNLISAGESDIFISKMDSAGNFQWAKRIGGTYFDFSYGLTLNSSGHIYSTGTFYGTVDFDPGSGIYNLSAPGNPDVFVLKLSDIGTWINEPVNNTKIFKVYPNPCNGILTLETTGHQINGPVYFEVYDIMGGKIITGDVYSGKTNIDLGNQSAGIFTVHLFHQGLVTVEKLILY